MTTVAYDIEIAFPNGVNTPDFQRAYVDELVAVAGFARGPAQQMAGQNNIADSARAPGTVQLVVSGTYNIESGPQPTLPGTQLAIDNAIASQTGARFSGPTLAELGPGDLPGEQRYAFDGERQTPAQGLGSWVYWDGAGNWRYMSGHYIAVTPTP